jgi:hypothetical protein
MGIAELEPRHLEMPLGINNGAYNNEGQTTK